MSSKISLLAVAAVALGVGCSEPAPPPPPFRPVAGTVQLMKSVVDPATDVIWGAVGTIMTTEETIEIFPRSEAEWLEIENAAVVMMESGNLLMIGDRAVDQDEWMQRSRELVDVGEQALVAAVSRDPDEVFRIGGDIYQVCTDCHEKYWTQDHDPNAGPDPSAALEKALERQAGDS